MFGYVMVDKGELKIKEYDIYRSYYCGLCQALKHKYKGIGQLTLNYDMTFLVLLLNGLYEPKEEQKEIRCLIHPSKKQAVRINETTEYAADMNIILAYYQCVDDWQDEKKMKKLLLSLLLKGKNKKATKTYEEKVERIVSLLAQLSQLEKENCQELDTVSGCFGNIMAEVLAYKKDEWESFLRKIGFYLGKYIYLLDAYEDMEEDKKKGNYNPYLAVWGEKFPKDYEQQIKSMLNMMLGECCRVFEQLPILEHVDILRNILYSGVWTRYDRKREKMKENKKQIANNK